jgi:thiol-disulfide isomerase/thioredoxin
MGDLVFPIAYLERSDFSDSGDLVGPYSGDKPTFIMIQGSYCGACNNAKPIFQKLANEGIIQCLTIQLDGERQSEKDIGTIINKIYPNLTGIPAFILYAKRQRIPYTGGRSVEEMKHFIQKYI